MPYEYRVMSDSEVEEFLQTPRRNAIVATIAADGSPQLTSVWYLLEEGLLCIPLLVESVKYRNLSRDPRVSVCIDAGGSDSRSVVVYGTGELVEGDREVEMFPRIARRYVDTEEAVKEITDAWRRIGDAALLVVTPKKTVARAL